MSDFYRHRLQVCHPAVSGIGMVWNSWPKGIHKFVHTGIGDPSRCDARRIHRSGGLCHGPDRVRPCLEQATGLPAVLDAAYEAFEEMLPALEEQEDRGGAAFVAFVMSATAAANGRDALAAAPSLPPAPSGDLAAAAAESFRGQAMEDAAAALAQLGQLLSSRLTDANGLSADPGDKVACAQAAHHAATICSLPGRTPEP